MSTGYYPMVLVLPYVIIKFSLFEKDIRHITEKAYYSAKLRLILKCSRMLNSKGKSKYQLKITVV